MGVIIIRGVYEKFTILKAKYYDRVIDAVAVLLFIAITSTVFFHVVLRYVFGSTPVFTEELSRFLLVWLIFISAAITYRFASHLSVDFFVNMLPKNFRRIWKIVIHLAVIPLLIVFILKGMDMVELGSRRISSGLGIPYSYPFLAVPVGSFLMLVENITIILKAIFGGVEKVEEEKKAVAEKEEVKTS